MRRKYGKYEKRPEAAAQKPAVNSALRQTYLLSLLSTVLCVAMLLGTTFAWFSSDVTNSANEIYIGTLDVGLSKLENGNWVSLADDESNEKLFDGNIKWEPGYTTLETVKVTNKGDLSFHYGLSFIAGDGQNAETLNTVAENFVVYVHKGDYAQDETAPVSFDQIKANAEQDDVSKRTWQPVRIGTKVATLADILNNEIPVFSGNMEDENAEETYIIALHMNGEEELTQTQQDALMGKRICVNVKLTAYQRSYEQDAFGAGYDLQADVTSLGELTIEGTGGEVTLDAAYQFQPVQSLEDIQNAPYKDYVVDFAVWADKDVTANSIALAGYYSLFCDGWNDGKWVVMEDTSNDVLETKDINEETPIRLVKDLYYPVTYKLLCAYGNDGIGFLCGIQNKSDANIGTTVTVELRLYVVDENGAETGDYIVAGRYEHTFA